MNTSLRDELLTLLDESYAASNAVMPELLGSPDDCSVAGVIARLRLIGERIAARLGSIVAVHGWPGVSVAGQAGARAAYRLVVHAVALPEFQRAMLSELERAAAAGEASWRDVASLEDRIRAMEGRPQRYGTLLRFDESGAMIPDPPIEEPERVDVLRARIGLGAVEEEARARGQALGSQRAPSADEIANRRRNADRWASLLGWRSTVSPRPSHSSKPA